MWRIKPEVLLPFEQTVPQSQLFASKQSMHATLFFLSGWVPWWNTMKWHHTLDWTFLPNASGLHKLHFISSLAVAPLTSALTTSTLLSSLVDFNWDCFIAVDEEVVRAFLEDGGQMPESEDANGLTYDVPLFVGAAVIGMANSSSVIGLGVSNTGEGRMLIATLISACVLLVNEGAMVDGWFDMIHRLAAEGAAGCWGYDSLAKVFVVLWYSEENES
jgi:hypothetical protein